jgi:hypothetical protein
MMLIDVCRGFILSPATVFFTNNQQQGRNNHCRSYNDYPATTRRVLNCRQAQLLPDFPPSISLSLVSLCTLVSVCVYVWRWISVDLSSSSSSRQKQEEKPFFLKKKLLPFLCSYSSCLCWFIYQDLRLYFDDHHHLFLVYFLCNFVSYRRDEFANTKGKSKR